MVLFGQLPYGQRANLNSLTRVLLSSQPQRAPPPLSPVTATATNAHLRIGLQPCRGQTSGVSNSQMSNHTTQHTTRELWWETAAWGPESTSKQCGPQLRRAEGMSLMAEGQTAKATHLVRPLSASAVVGSAHLLESAVGPRSALSLHANALAA